MSINYKIFLKNIADHNSINSAVVFPDYVTSRIKISKSSSYSIVESGFFFTGCIISSTSRVNISRTEFSMN